MTYYAVAREEVAIPPVSRTDCFSAIDALKLTAAAGSRAVCGHLAGQHCCQQEPDHPPRLIEIIVGAGVTNILISRVRTLKTMEQTTGT